MPHRTPRVIAAILMVAALIPSAPARADTINVEGRITKAFVSAGYNYAFRVHLQSNGTDALTACNSSFAFINIDDDNYQARVSTLLSAQAQKQLVGMTVSRDAGSWCRILDLWAITN